MARRNRSRYAPYFRAGRRILKGIGNAVKTYAPYMRPSFSPTVNYRSESNYHGGVTSQHDKKNVYRKKYMKKYKKRQWKKFVKKVNAVNLRDRGLVTALYNNVFNRSATTASGQCFFEMHLYGFKSALAGAAAGCNDLATLISSDMQTRYGNDWMIPAPGVNADGASTRSPFTAVEAINFESGILDATITNDNDSTIELDVYHITYGNKIKGNWNSLETAFSNYASTLTDTVQTDATTLNLGVSLANRGATPFELGGAISSTGMKIVKKEKFLISAGQAITLQYRDPKNRRFNPLDFLNSNNSFRYNNWTKSFMLIAKKVKEDSTPCTLRIGCTRSYKYTYEGLKTNKAYRLTI